MKEFPKGIKSGTFLYIHIIFDRHMAWFFDFVFLRLCKLQDFNANGQSENLRSYNYYSAVELLIKERFLFLTDEIA